MGKFGIIFNRACLQIFVCKIKLYSNWENYGGTKLYFSTLGMAIYMYPQHSKLIFSKSCLLATFNCKMVTIKKKNLVAKKKKKPNIQGRTLCACYMNVYGEQHICNTFLCRIITFTRLSIKRL